MIEPPSSLQQTLELDPADLSRTFAAARRLARVMKERLGADDVALWNSCGRIAGQVVVHFHIHVIPTQAGDPELPRPENLADPVDVAEAAAALRGG